MYAQIIVVFKLISFLLHFEQTSILIDKTKVILVTFDHHNMFFTLLNKVDLTNVLVSANSRNIEHVSSSQLQ